jgi:hypothetical protein
MWGESGTVYSFTILESRCQVLFAAFSFCYILAHYGLGLLTDEQCQNILTFVETNLPKIKTAVSA